MESRWSLAAENKAEDWLGSNILKAISFTCAVGGVVLLWGGYWSEELESTSNESTLDEVVSRADLNHDIAFPQASTPELTEYFASGRVIDSAGNGIIEALVSVENSREETYSVSTQENGSFVLIHFAVVNRVEIEISADGFFPGYVEIEADKPDVQITLLRSGRLEGRAVDSQANKPIDHFTVSLFVGNKLMMTNSPDVSVEFHEQSGYFTITDLEHVQMDVFARADGYQPLILRGIAVSGQTEYVELRFEEARTIAGRVIGTSSAEVIPGAEVSVLGSQSQLNLRRPGPPVPLPGQSTKTSEDGTFSLNELSREVLNLHIRVDGYVAKTINVGSVDEGDIEVLLAPASSVAGRLFGVDGSSPEVGGIRLQELKSGRSGSSRTRDDGRFVLQNLPPGDYVFSARSSAGKSGQIELTLREGEHIDSLRLQILPGNELTGRVSGLMPGETVVGVQANRPGQVPIGKRADAAGNYALRGLPTGMIEIVAKTTKGRSLSKFIELQATTVAYLDFVFDGTAIIYGRITRGGAPLIKTRIKLIPVDRDQPLGSTYTSENGTYSIEGLADRKYVFSINGEGKRYITLNGSTQFDVDL